MCHSVGRGHRARGGGGEGGRGWSRRMSFPKMIGNFDYTTHVFSLHISQIKPFSGVSETQRKRYMLKVPNRDTSPQQMS